MNTIGIVQSFRDFYADLGQADLSNLSDIYAENVMFIDPVHRLQGRNMLHDYLSHTVNGCLHCHFTFEDRFCMTNQTGHLNGSATFKWQMNFAHKSIRQGKSTIVPGSSFVEYRNGLIDFHEDVYDLGAMLYEHLPIFGFVVKKIKMRLVA